MIWDLDNGCSKRYDIICKHILAFSLFNFGLFPDAAVMCQSMLAYDVIVFVCSMRQVLRVTNLQIFINPTHILRKLLLTHRLS